MSFAKIMAGNIDKNISKTLGGKYSQKLLHHTKRSAKDALKTIQKKEEATGDLIGNEIANRIIKVPKTLPKNNSETVTNEHDGGIPKERFISLEERQNFIDDLRLIS